MGDQMNQRKTILFAANDTTFVYNLRKEIIEDLCNRDQDVIIVAQFKDYIEELKDIGCKLIELKIPRRGKNPFSDINLYNHIKHILKENEPDIVFSNSIKPNVYFGIATSKLGIPFVPNVTGLGSALLNPGSVKKIAHTLYKMGVKNSKTIFFQNNYNKEYFYNSKIIGKSKDCLVLPGSGINLEKYSYFEYPETDRSIKFIMIARIMRDKGIFEFLNAAEIIKSKYPNVEFTLVGDYDDLSFKDRIDKLNDNGIITYLGYRQDIDELIKKSHCIVHPSYHEGLSNVLLEAGATGRPVIASDIPGCRETFIDGVSGLAVKVKDSDDLTRKIEEFINIPHNKKAQMGKANREHVAKKFDRKIVVDKYIECIEKYAK